MRAAYTIDLSSAPRRGTLSISPIEADAMKMTIAPALLCALTLAACSDKPPPAQSSPTPAATTAQASNTPWSAMKQDEQRAKDVAKQANQAQANEQQQIQQQSQ
jgi:hypothetical protein